MHDFLFDFYAEDILKILQISFWAVYKVRLGHEKIKNCGKVNLLKTKQWKYENTT